MRPLRTERPFTWEDYLELPESPLRHEVLDGELVVSPAPNLRHQRVLARLYRALHAAIQDAGHGEVLFAPVDVKLSRTDVVQPDLLVVLARDAGRLNPKYLDGAPSLAVEVVSPGTGRRDRGLKQARYALHAIAEYWVVDPVDDVVDQFVLDGAQYRGALECRDEIKVALLPGIAIDLRPIFRAEG
jgi:Uma2 family endonuclease